MRTPNTTNPSAGDASPPVIDAAEAPGAATIGEDEPILEIFHVLPGAPEAGGALPPVEPAALARLLTEPVVRSDADEAGPSEPQGPPSPDRDHRVPPSPGRLFDLTAAAFPGSPATDLQGPPRSVPLGRNPPRPIVIAGPPHPRVVHIEYSAGISNFSFRIQPRLAPETDHLPATINISISLDIPDPGDELDTITVNATVNAPNRPQSPSA